MRLNTPPLTENPVKSRSAIELRIVPEGSENPTPGDWNLPATSTPAIVQNVRGPGFSNDGALPLPPEIVVSPVPAEPQLKPPEQKHGNHHRRPSLTHTLQDFCKVWGFTKEEGHGEIDMWHQGFCNARSSMHPRDKAQFIDLANKHLFPRLPTREATLQIMAHWMAYLYIPAIATPEGDRFAITFKIAVTRDIENMPVDNFSGTYKKTDEIKEGLLAHLLEPANATNATLILFRGTAASQDPLAAAAGCPTGGRDDLDERAVGYTAVCSQFTTLKEWIRNTFRQRPDSELWLAGHSLGGGEIKVLLALLKDDEEVRDFLPKIHGYTFQAPRMPQDIADDIDATLERGASLDMIVGTNDAVSTIGEADPPGARRIKYQQRRVWSGDNHLRPELAAEELESGEARLAGRAIPTRNGWKHPGVYIEQPGEDPISISERLGEQIGGLRRFGGRVLEELHLSPRFRR